MAVLHLHPRAVDVEEGLDAELGAGAAAVVLGQGRMTVRSLLERAFSARPRPVRLGPVGERLLVDAVASEEAVGGGLLAPLRGTLGLGESLRRLIGDWQLAGIEPAQVAALARRAGPLGPRLAALGDLFARYRQRLGSRLDEAGVRRAALATLRGDGRPLAFLAGVDRVVVHRAGADASQLEVVEALAARGLTVVPELPLVAGPGQSRPALERALEPLLRRLETLVDLPIEPLYSPPGTTSPADDAGTRLSPLLAELFRPLSSRRSTLAPAPPVELCAAPTPDAEARAVARAVRDLLEGGAAPQTIAVCARRSSDRDRVARWLGRYRVPHLERPGRPVTAAVPVRLALQLGRLADDGVPREALIGLLSSRYASGSTAPGGAGARIAPHRLARILRQAGVRDVDPEGGVPGYRGRLDELAQSCVSASRRSEVERVAARVDQWLAFLTAIPTEATFAEQALALSRAVDALGLPLLARGYASAAEAGLDDVDEVARDQAAMAALSRLLADVPRAAVRAGMGADRIDRSRFSRLLEGVLEGETLRPGGASGGRVELTAPERVAGRRFAHVLVLGLVDGVVPTSAAEDPLLSDDERRRFNRLAGGEVLPLAASIDEREPLLFLEMCAAATVSLRLSCALADETGRPLLPSPFLDDVSRVSGIAVRAIDHDPVPLAADCRTPAELRARVLLETEAPAASRISRRDPDASAALTTAVDAAWPAELAAARTVAAIEQRRLQFFDGRLEADRYSGRLEDADLLRALAAALPGSAEQPLSASAIEDYASCAFRFFGARLLHLEPAEENADDLDPRAGGRLYHRILERLFRRLADGGGLPLRGRPEELDELDAAIDEVLAGWGASEQRGHPALFTVRGVRVRRDLRALIRAEGKDQFFAPLQPRYFEHSLTGRIPAGRGSGADLHLRAVVDRIDVQGDGAVVIDYKSGRLPGLRKLLADDALLITSFQLPLYAAIARSELGLRAVSARYMAIRDARPTGELPDDRRFTLEAGAPAGGVDGRGPTLAAAVTALHRAMEQGDFRVAPRSCEHCDLAAVCRVVLKSGLSEEGLE